MPDFIYRFRPVRALLEGFHELEKQEIYFASPAELNDPYDGAREVQWSGDAILWSNLLNHYLLCLTQAVLSASINPDDPKVLDSVSIFATEDALASDQAKTLHRRTKGLFFGDADAARLPDLLAARLAPVGRDELRMYLRVLHVEAVDTVQTAMEELGWKSPRPGRGLPGTPKQAAGRCGQMLTMINAEEKAGPEHHNLGGMFGHLTESFFYQQSLQLSLDGGTALAHARAWHAVLSDFPARYLSELEKLLYSEWFTACFVEDPTHAAMWGHYGDRHQGVALKFRTTLLAGQPTLTLNGITGWSGGKGRAMQPVRGDVPHLLHEVQYQRSFAQLEFFQAMGRITGAMTRFWHCDAEGNRSPRITAEGFGSDEWRQRYWQMLTSALVTKHVDWAYERERRIILKGGLIDYGAGPESRKLVYRFADLEGIIFGAKTPAAQVVEVVQAIRVKCRNAGRKHFEFFRAEYSPPEGKMILAPLPMLKVQAP